MSTLAESETRVPGRFAESRAEGYIRIGEELTRALRYDDAEKELLEGAYDIKEILRKLGGGVFQDLQRDSAKSHHPMASSGKDDLRSFWTPRAVFWRGSLRAGTEFRFLDRNLLISAFTLIEQDVARAEAEAPRGRSLRIVPTMSIEEGALLVTAVTDLSNTLQWTNLTNCLPS